MISAKILNFEIGGLLFFYRRHRVAEITKSFFPFDPAKHKKAPRKVVASKVPGYIIF